MDFWQTVLGHQLADTLIRTLPKIAEHYKEGENSNDELLTVMKGIARDIEDIKYMLDTHLNK